MSSIDSNEIRSASEMISDIASKLRKSISEIESDMNQIKNILNTFNFCNGARAGAVSKSVKKEMFGEKTIHKVERWKIDCSPGDTLNVLSPYKLNLDLLDKEEADLSEIANTLDKLVGKIEKDLGIGYIRHYLFKDLNEDKADFKSYDLSDEELLQLARLCAQEQGSNNPNGILWEASLIANKYELSGGKGDDGKQYNNIVDYAKYCGWWEKSEDVMNGSEDHKNGNPVNKETIALVKEVFNNKRRVLPKYIDEHDLINDLSDVRTNNVSINKENYKEYIPYKTDCIQDTENIKNGGSWTYYGHPSKDSDPFGYTSVDNINKYGEYCCDDMDVINYVKKQQDTMVAENSSGN